MRALGGVIFTAGMILFVVNVLKTIQKGRALEAAATAEAASKPLAAVQA
jgi:cbb3-type cytochrome oxidase subunit 1